MLERVDYISKELTMISFKVKSQEQNMNWTFYGQSEWSHYFNLDDIQVNRSEWFLKNGSPMASFSFI